MVNKLLERGYRVAVFDVVVPPTTPENVQVIQGDICDAKAFNKALMDSKANIVFHVASIIDIRPIPSPTMRRVNVEGTRVVVEQCRKSDYCKTLVYTSSIEVVAGILKDGKRQIINGCDESVEIPEHHFLEYAATKAAAEKLVLEADRDADELRTCSIRPGFIIGNECVGHKISMQWAAARYNYDFSCNLPSKLSCVNPKNCADLHIIAAEKSELSHGQVFFASDFHANYFEMKTEAYQDITVCSVFLPLWLAMSMGWIMDRWERLLHVLFNLIGWTRRTSHDVISFDAMKMGWFNVIVTSKKAQNVLGWKPQIPREQTMDEARLHANTFWSSLVGPENAFNAFCVPPRVSGKLKSS